MHFHCGTMNKNAVLEVHCASYHVNFEHPHQNVWWILIYSCNPLTSLAWGPVHKRAAQWLFSETLSTPICSCTPQNTLNTHNIQWQFSNCIILHLKLNVLCVRILVCVFVQSTLCTSSDVSTELRLKMIFFFKSIFWKMRRLASQFSKSYKIGKIFHRSWSHFFCQFST